MSDKKSKKKQAKGVLPSDEWLIRNDMEGLVRAKEKHPEAFAHIRQNPNLNRKCEK